MQTNEIRRQIANVLTEFAQKEEWDSQLWSTFEGLKKQTTIDSLIAKADEELIHYSGCFATRNI